VGGVGWGGGGWVASEKRAPLGLTGVGCGKREKRGKTRLNWRGESFLKGGGGIWERVQGLAKSMKSSEGMVPTSE